MLRACYFVCESCGTKYEELLEKPYGVWPWDPTCECPNCGHENVQSIGTTGIAAFSIQDRQSQLASLKKRSEDHSRKMNKQNADKIASMWNNGRGVKV